MGKLVAALDKVKTPLTLGGLVVIVLYGIYSQVLKLFGPNSFPRVRCRSSCATF